MKKNDFWWQLALYSLGVCLFLFLPCFKYSEATGWDKIEDYIEYWGSISRRSYVKKYIVLFFLSFPAALLGVFLSSWNRLIGSIICTIAFIMPLGFILCLELDEQSSITYIFSLVSLIIAAGWSGFNIIQAFISIIEKSKE